MGYNIRVIGSALTGKGEQTMPDREKVIKGLHQHCECSLFDRCGECPYYETDYDSWEESKFKCRDALLHDAIAMLKEKEAEIRQLRLALDIAKGTCKGIQSGGGQFADMPIMQSAT